MNVKQTMEAVNRSVPTHKEDHESAAAGLGSLWLVMGEIVEVSSYMQYYIAVMIIYCHNASVVQISVEPHVTSTMEAVHRCVPIHQGHDDVAAGLGSC